MMETAVGPILVERKVSFEADVDLCWNTLPTGLLLTLQASQYASPKADGVQVRAAHTNHQFQATLSKCGFRWETVPLDCHLLFVVHRDWWALMFRIEALYHNRSAAAQALLHAYFVADQDERLDADTRETLRLELEFDSHRKRPDLDKYLHLFQDADSVSNAPDKMVERCLVWYAGRRDANGTCSRYFHCRSTRKEEVQTYDWFLERPPTKLWDHVYERNNDVLPDLVLRDVLLQKQLAQLHNNPLLEWTYVTAHPSFEWVRSHIALRLLTGKESEYVASSKCRGATAGKFSAKPKRKEREKADKPRSIKRAK